MRSLNDAGSAVPLFLFIVTIVVAGALFSLFFIVVGFPLLDLIPIPSSSYKTFIIYAVRGIPLIVLIVGCVSLILVALKNERGWYS